jgi:hypothetical protein
MRPLFEAIIAHMMSLQHEYALRPRSPVPPVISGKTEVARPPGDIRLSEVVVLTGALTESEWDKVRAFVRRTSRESLRLRFGQSAYFADDIAQTLLRHQQSGSGDDLMLEEGGDICAISHLVQHRRRKPKSHDCSLGCARRGTKSFAHHAACGAVNPSTLSFVLHENRDAAHPSTRLSSLISVLSFNKTCAAGKALADDGGRNSIEVVAC